MGTTGNMELESHSLGKRLRSQLLLLRLLVLSFLLRSMVSSWNLLSRAGRFLNGSHHSTDLHTSTTARATASTLRLQPLDLWVSLCQPSLWPVHASTRNPPAFTNVVIRYGSFIVSSIPMINYIVFTNVLQPSSTLHHEDLGDHDFDPATAKRTTCGQSIQQLTMLTELRRVVHQLTMQLHRPWYSSLRENHVELA